MRSATLTVALLTGAIVIWMVSFAARPSSLYHTDSTAAPVAAQADGGAAWNRP